VNYHHHHIHASDKYPPVLLVLQLAYDATVLMGENGGFEGLVEVKTAKKPNRKRTAAIANDAVAGSAGTSREGSSAAPTAPSSRVMRSSMDGAPPPNDQGGSVNKRSRR
jgi:hypothetical protein